MFYANCVVFGKGHRMLTLFSSVASNGMSAGLFDLWDGLIELLFELVFETLLESIFFFFELIIEILL